MKTKWLVTFGMAGLICFSGCRQVVDREKDAAALLQTDIDFAAMSAEKGAAEAFHYYLADDAMQFPEGRSPVSGRDSIYYMMKRSSIEYQLIWEPQKAEVSASGEMGWTWGRSVFAYTDTNGLIKKEYGKYLTVWEKQADGTWKAVADIGNEDATPAKDKKSEDE